MGLSCIYWTYCAFVFYHVTFSAVECQAPINVRAVYNPQTRTITVTWEDDPRSPPVNSYLLSYNADTITIQYEYPTTTSYNFTPPVLGTTYTIEVFADRSGRRRASAVTRVIAATPVYSAEGGTSSITLAGEDNTAWEVRHYSEQELFMFGDQLQTNNLINTTTTVQILRDPPQVTLTFNSVTRNDAGVYISKRRTGSIVFTSVVLIVTVKPSIPVISQQSVAVIANPVELRCRAESKSVPKYHGLALSYSWRLNDTDIQSNAKYAVTNDVLRIKKLEFIDRYNRYICTATEERGLTSDVSLHILNLYYGPQSVTLRPTTANITVQEGANISPIICAADCNPSCTLQWKKKRQPSNIGVGSGAELNLGSADRNEDGQYRCVAVGNSAVPETLRTRRSQYVNIDVKYPAAITEVQYSINSATNMALQNGQQIQVMETSELVITCTADADPNPTVKLLDKQNKTLSDGLDTATLKTDAKCEDTGMYAFQAFNSFNTAPARQDFILKVYCQPRELYNAPKIFGGKRDERIVFMTTVIAYPAPKATWDRFVTDNDVMAINDFTFNVSAYVDILGEESYGNYSVTISNGQGQNLVLQFVIRSEYRPDVPMNFTSVEISHNTANLTWISPFNGGSVQKFTIEQKQTQPQTTWLRIATDIEDNGQNKVHFYVAKNLKPDTSYQFKLYSKNTIGSSEAITITIATIAAPVTQFGKTNSALVGGVVVGSFVIIVLIVAIVIFLWKRKGTKGNTKTEEVLYAVPQKPKPDKPQVQDKEVIYENSAAPANEAPKTDKQEPPPPEPERVPQREVNQDGLIYIDVEIKQQPKAGNKKPVIHGDDDRTNYTFIDFTKKADPLPNDENESEYANHQ